MESRWKPGGNQVESRCCAGGVQVESRWSPGDGPGPDLSVKRSEMIRIKNCWYYCQYFTWSSPGTHLLNSETDYLSRNISLSVECIYFK